MSDLTNAPGDTSRVYTGPSGPFSADQTAKIGCDSTIGLR